MNSTIKFLLLIFCLTPLLSSAQKGSNFFVETGVDFTGNNDLVVAATYNYSPLGKFGIGASLEASEHHINYIDRQFAAVPVGWAPLADFRYYFNTPAGFAIPILQMGYNILDDRGEINAISFHTVGGLQYSMGGCFAFRMTKSGRGLTAGAKYINRSFSETAVSQSGDTGHKYSTSGVAVTIGFRF